MPSIPLFRASMAGLTLVGALAPQQAYSPFDAATQVVSESNPPLRRLADLDLDGDVDAVGWQVSQQGRDFRVRSYKNDGNGVLQSTAVRNAFSVDASTVLLGEVGLLDVGPVPDLSLVHGNERHDFYGTGDGSFSVGPIEVLPTAALAIALCDLDGDGRDDLVWVDEGRLRLKISSSGGQASVLHGVLGPISVRVLLRDGPNTADVFLVHGTTSVALFHGTPSGITPVASFEHGVPMSMFDTGDVDGDGDGDAVVFGMQDYRVLRRTAVSGWTLEPALVGGPAQFLRDVDGDGDLDGACCGGGGPTFERNNQPSPFEIALNDGSGAFAPAFALPNLGSPEFAGVADMDVDGDLDLVAGLCVYFSRGGVRPPPSAPPGAVVPEARDPRDVADCNGDGYPDVGFSVEGAFLNDGAGYFVATPHTVSGTPNGTFLRGPGFPGDFDGDGDLDLLAELHAGRARLLRARAPGHGRSLLGMALLTNDGAGRLSYAGPASAPGISFALDSLEASASRVADLDGDGDFDLITRALDPLASSPVVSALWLNDGDGSFQSAPFLADRRVEAVADLDLDGRLDLVVTEYPLYFGLPNLRILRALATSPASPPEYVDDLGHSVGRLVSGSVVVGNLFSLEFPDLGYPDLLFLGGYPQGSWMGGNGYDPGSGSWGSVILGSDLPTDAIVQVGDLNLDGLEDQLAGAYGLSVKRAEVRTQVGPTWWDGLVSNTQLLPAGLLVDLDLDGDLDLLGERVVRNLTIP